MADLDDIVKEFLVESYENLDQLDRDFVALETNPTATDQLGSIFRTIHTIKGTCGCLGLRKLESVAHVGENLLSRLRDGQLVMDTEIASGLLKLVDAIREILASIESAGNEGEKEYTEIRDYLIRLNERPSNSGINTHTVASLTLASHAPERAAVAAALEPAAPPAPVSAPVETATEATAIASNGETTAKDSKESVAGNAIRVDVVLLDKLMNLVGELVLARNQVLQHTAGQKDAGLLRTAQRLNLITSELQEGVMKTRMQPIGNLWNKFPRIVRDVANSCGKKVGIEMEGVETELDKTIIEAIKDPLTHVIRNSVDHGVETPAERIKAGKPEEGRLLMRAFHEGGQVNIEISDDGKGINPDRVKAKAVEKGLITAEHAARMSEREATNLVFLPGFSTAEKITNVSGRGVGMDVVKTNVERIGGTVDIKTKVGQGTVLRIRIPLTLAIIPALVVTTGGERFAIPQVNLLELVRLEGNDSRIESIHGAPIYRLRGKLLPLVYLNRVMNIQADADTRSKQTSSNIVVLSAAEHQFGLVVDVVNDTEEIVVKPLGKQLKGINVFSGATIMGDGRVALILDVVGLAQKAHVVSQAGAHAVAQTTEVAHAVETNKQTLLLFKLRNEQRMAVPLSLVSRLEEFDQTAMERAGKHHVVQYRGEIMPLINLADVVGERRGKCRTGHARAGDSKISETTSGEDRAAQTDGKIQVVVFEHLKRNIGVRVETILDVVDEEVRMQEAGTRPGVRGTAVVKEKVTEVIDLTAIIQNSNVMQPAAAA
jgi:two-component system chemotaxis sensor kinase CheA